VGVGAALATATETSPYSGFNDAIQKWGMGTKASIARDLKWQCDVDGDPQKTTQFKEVVGGLQDFRTYLFMKPGSAFVMVMHSPDEVCRDQQSNTASPRKVYWLHWGPHPHEGSHLDRTPTTENVELGDENRLNRRRGNGRILR
jgi:hypothetical protein